MKEDGDLKGIDIEVEIEKAKKSGSSEKAILDDGTVIKSIVREKKMTGVKIESEENGEKKVMIWDGEGEMPAEMAEKLKHLDINTERTIIGDEETMRITIDAEEDENSEINETYTIEESVVVKHKSENKISLGIMIEDDSQGVIVSDIVPGSTADNIGLKKGDTILQIDDSYIFNTEMLISALSRFDKGDSARITYLRDGRKNVVRAAF